jgi:hypothetical protein
MKDNPMTAPTGTDRFVVTPHQGPPGATGAAVTTFRVYDNHERSYPRSVGGRVVQERYSARDHAQGAANQLNEENL